MQILRLKRELRCGNRCTIGLLVLVIYSNNQVGVRQFIFELRCCDEWIVRNL